METSMPVFSDRADMRLWKKMSDLEAGLAARNAQKNAFKVKQIIKDICNIEGCANSHLLCKVMDLINAYGLDDVEKTLFTLIEKCDLSDSTSQLKAAGMFIDIGSIEAAKLVLDRISVISNKAMWDYQVGRTLLAGNDIEGALSYFRNARNMNHRFLPVYTELEKLDPDHGWVFLKNIMMIRNEMPSRPYGDDLPNCSMEELYGVYWEWESGNHVGAIESLKKMTGFMSGDPEFILAAARMTRDDGDYPSSIEFYKNIVGDPNTTFSISLELARVYISADMPEKALDLCLGLELVSIADRRLSETVMQAHTALENRAELKKCADMFLYHEYVDVAAYVFTIDLFTSLSMHSEASALIDKVTISCPDADIVPLLISKNDYESQRYSAALSAANKAIRRMPEHPECKCQRAKVYLAIGNTKKALRDVNDVLDKDCDNREALLMKKTILEHIDDDYGAYEICRTLLKNDSRDADIIRDSANLLEKLGKEDEAIAMYRDALGIRKDLSLFLKVLTFLVENGKYEKAIQIVSEYDDIYGDHAEAWIFKGNSEYAVGRYLDASDSFLKATDIEYNNPTIWHSKGMSDEAAGKYDDAETAYDKAVLMDLDNPEFWISKAAVQEKKGDFIAATESLNRVISEHPENTYALMRKATILVRLGKMKEATLFIGLASRIDPANISITKVKRDIYIYLKEYQTVVSICDSILLSEPGDIKTMLDKSDAFVALERYNDALEILEKARGLDPDSLDVLRSIRQVHHICENVEEEIRICKAILMKDENDRSIKMALADALVKQGNITYANKLYDELREIDPQDTSLFIRKAKISVDSGDENKALKILKESLDADPDNVDILMELAELSSASGKTIDALSYADKAIELDPKSSKTYLKKARIQIDYGTLSSAQETLNIALHKSSVMDPIIWVYMGEVQEKLGDHSNALISYDSAIKMGIDKSELYRSRGRVQEALGLKDAAMNSYSIASLRDKRDVFSLWRIAVLQIDSGRESVAAKYLDDAISINPTYGPIIIERAKIFLQHKDPNGLRRMLDLSASVDPADENMVMRIRGMYEGLGIQADPVVAEHTDVKQQVIDEPHVDDDVIQNAKTLLRAAYDTGFALDDNMLIKKAGIPQELITDVLNYLSDIKECEVIVPGTPEFERMENLSYNAVMKEFNKEIESDPMIPLTTAYFLSGADSIDEAKKLIAYIYRAMTMDLEPAFFDNRITNAVDGIAEGSGDITVFGIMKSYSLGVFSARTVKMLSVKRGESVVDHI